MSIRRLLFISLLVLSATRAWAQEVDPRLVSGSEAIRGRIGALADWCETVKMLRERQRLLELALTLSPNDKVVREAAGYDAITSKRWQRKKGFRSPLRTNPDEKVEFETRFGSIMADLLLLFGQIPKDDEPALPLADCRDVVESMLIIAPREPALLEALGEKKKGTRWYLEESLAARGRRDSVRQQAELLLEGVGTPAKLPVPDPEQGFDLRWRSARLLPDVEVVGTVSDDEIETAAKIAWATNNWFQLAMRRSAEPFQGFRVVLLKNLEERDLYLHFDPRVNDEYRRFAERLSSAWIPSSSTVLIWNPEKDKRTEWVARQTTAMLLLRGYGITSKQGAVYEGFGLYLSHKITGMRSTWFVKQTRYDQKYGDNLSIEDLERQKSWLKLAKRQTRTKPTDYRRLLSLDVNQMEVEDLVPAYALAAYLIEGAPDRLNPFLERLGQGMNFEFAVREVWGLDPLELGAQVARWLKESVDG